MKKILFLSIIFFSALVANSQCFEFAKELARTQLAPYIHDGNYNTAVLNEGQEAEIHKTFFAGQKYRILVGKEDNLPNIEFKIFNPKHQLLFSNSNNKEIDSWDFQLEESQKLIISLKVLKKENPGQEPISGCISILIGLIPN